ncbi:MAG: FtsK/SpoIIIE domain-containing protein, partial [Armatimonadota bacterium]|nr:FtsK/SpoIIIE domain-containing protein [Armatimonadota bacterium]
MSTFTFLHQGEGFEGCLITFDPAPDKGLVDQVIKQVGERARDAMRVEVAFSDLLEMAGMPERNWWSKSSKDLIEVPLGPRGATDVQMLQVGTGLAHHGLIIGRPGSGKTNLMHVIITGLALEYGPDELELYLIDFKKGVGFKAYADYALPHARVIAIESEREFGISVLRGLDKELSRRGELFRAAGGAEKLSEYRERTGEQMTRIVLIADEFQEFFTVEDAISREASLLFDRIVRQGRAFGIHIILGTQTLAGSYGMSRSTVDQMSIRVALQCSEADSRLVLGDDNPGARFLSRPGEAIYNAENGLVQANKLFQVAMFTDKDKEEFLARIRAHATNGVAARKPIVFEGHLPAHLETSEEFKELLESPKPNLRRGVNAWLGEPIAIKEPTHARLRRQAGSNLVVVTRDEEQGLGVLTAALTTLAVQHSEDACRFIIADYTTADAEWAECFETFCDEMPHEATVVRRRQVPEAVKEVLQEVEFRHVQNATPASNLFFVIAGVQRARELRKDEDDFSNNSPSDDLLKILRDGPEVGVHCLV